MLALELKHPFSVAYARCWFAWVSQFRRDVSTTREQADAAVALATEQGFTLWAAKATIYRGWALAMEGKGKEGSLELEKGIAAWRATGAGATLSYYSTMQAEAFELLGKPEDALQEVDKARAELEKADERWWEAEIYRLRGVLLLQHSWRPRRKRNPSFDARWRSLAASTPNRLSCAPPPASRACGAISASTAKRTTYSHPSTVGLLRDSKRRT